MFSASQVQTLIFVARIASAPLETALMWADSVAKQFHSGVFCLRAEHFLEESVQVRLGTAIWILSNSVFAHDGHFCAGTGASTVACSLASGACLLIAELYEGTSGAFC